MYAYAYGAFVYETLLRRPPLADNIGPRYCMLDWAFDKGHRARFIENGKVSDERNFDQSSRIDENDFLTFWRSLFDRRSSHCA